MSSIAKTYSIDMVDFMECQALVRTICTCYKCYYQLFSLAFPSAYTLKLYDVIGDKDLVLNVVSAIQENVIIAGLGNFDQTLHDPQLAQRTR
jgi:hypothetical protein